MKFMSKIIVTLLRRRSSFSAVGVEGRGMCTCFSSLQRFSPIEIKAGLLNFEERGLDTNPFVKVKFYFN